MVTRTCTAAGCALKNYSTAAGGICVPKGYEAGAISESLVQERADCVLNTPVGTSFSRACVAAAGEFALRTGCSELCIQEGAQGRTAVCQAQTSGQCETTKAPPCAQYTGGADATGMPLLLRGESKMRCWIVSSAHDVGASDCIRALPLLLERWAPSWLVLHATATRLCRCLLLRAKDQPVPGDNLSRYRMVCLGVVRHDRTWRSLRCQAWCAVVFLRGRLVDNIFRIASLSSCGDKAVVLQKCLPVRACSSILGCRAPERCVVCAPEWSGALTVHSWCRLQTGQVHGRRRNYLLRSRKLHCSCCICC